MELQISPVLNKYRTCNQINRGYSRMSRSVLLILAGLVLFSLPGCSGLSDSTDHGGGGIDVSDLETEVMPGVINPSNDSDRPSFQNLPDQVSVSETFQVELITYGSSNCIEPSTTEVESSDHTITLRVYDEVIVDSQFQCSPDAAGHSRDVSLTLNEPGTFEIILIGRHISSDEETSIVKSVEVKE
jgi:hypothetical protein